MEATMELWMRPEKQIIELLYNHIPSIVSYYLHSPIAGEISRIVWNADCVRRVCRCTLNRSLSYERQRNRTYDGNTQNRVAFHDSFVLSH